MSVLQCWLPNWQRKLSIWEDTSAPPGTVHRSFPLLPVQVPIYVHAKEVLTPDGKREAIELNYMTFLAYNGWYRLFDCIYLGKIGAHDADWVGELSPWAV